MNKKYIFSIINLFFNFLLQFTWTEESKMRPRNLLTHVTTYCVRGYKNTYQIRTSQQLLCKAFAMALHH